VSGTPDLGELAAIVGGQNLLTDPELVAGFCVDFTGRFRGSTPAVVRPAGTAEVAAVVRWCRQHGVAVVPQGGNTGLVGGGVPLDGEVVLSAGRLTAAIDVDEAGGHLTAAAGVTIAAVQHAAADPGWAYGVDFAARDSATVGGSIATNAGGLRHLRHGDTRRQLVGIEAVLGTGDVVSHLAGLDKDNTGYDLAGLLCGSEGTLGVITAATLRLVPRAPERVTALLGFGDLAGAVSAAAQLRRGVPGLEALELVRGDGVALVCDRFGLPMPMDPLPPVLLLAEAAGTEDPSAVFADAVEGLEGVVAVSAAVDPHGRGRLWRYRELHTEAINQLGTPHKLDVTLPQSEIAAFTEELPAVVAAAAPAAALWLFGHLGDGNLHVNLTGIGPDDDVVDDAVLRLVASYRGSISAEHGIGTAKRRWLHLNRSDAELRAFRAIKAALDPDGICNPGALLP
jgi:FAD/FMN-containing dehydrogenase